MTKSRCLPRLLLAVFLIAGLPRWANAQNAPTPAKTQMQIVTDGKKATALVVTPEGMGSSFCIQDSGVFVTNAHVVGDYDRVKIVVNPGETNQHILTARVTHDDEDDDLAVLALDPPLSQQVPDMGPLTTLHLGTVDGLFETMPITIFGYPFGTYLALGEGEMPAVTVNTGRITAFRKLQGKLKELQVDAAVNPGNSGGPALNENGEVIGIIRAKMANGEGVNFAIPVDVLNHLLTTPEIRFDPGPMMWAERSTPQLWTVRILPPFLSGTNTAAPTGQLDLDLFVGKENAWRQMPVVRAQIGLHSKASEFRAVGNLFNGDQTGQDTTDFKVVLKQDGKEIATRTGSIWFVGAPFIPRKDADDDDGFGVQQRFPSGPLVKNPANGHFYQAICLDDDFNWDDVKEFAEGLKYQGIPGHLATITTAQESDFIINQVLPRAGQRSDHYWLGGFQPDKSPEPDGGWKWVTGEPWDGTNWAQGEPNNAGAGRNENLLQLNADGSWNDAADDDGFGAATCFIEEFEAPPQ